MHRLISTLTKQFWGWTLLALVLMPGDIKAQSLALPELTFLPIAGEKTADQSCNTATVDGSQDQSPVIPDTRRLTAYCVAQVFPVHGRWTALDNVANFDLKVLNPGPDYYHNRVNGRAVSTKCLANQGNVVVDHDSATGRDACSYSPAEKLATCGSGNLQISGTTAQCVFPVHGRWTALDNVANFDLKVLNPGPDYYHNRVNGRAVSTKCANGEGSVVVDFSSGGHDSCVRPVSCEAGYQLVIR